MHPDYPSSNILITATDHAKLRSMLSAGTLFACTGSELAALRAELARAEVLPSKEIPDNVITLNSRAELLDLETGERMDFALVLPSQANVDEGRISILAPLGIAMLGYRVNDVFELPAPMGVRRLKVTHVHFQPEAALALAA